MHEDELIDTLAKYNGFEKDYKSLFPNKEETIRLLMKITLPNDLDDSFFEKEKQFLKCMNSRLTLLNPKELIFSNNVALVKHDPLTIDAEAFFNPLYSSFYEPEQLMKRSLNDELVFHGGLEIRKDLLQILAKQKHEMKPGDIYLTDGYSLPFKRIYHLSLPQETKNMDDINSISKSFLSAFDKEISFSDKKYIVIPLSEEKKEENFHFLKLAISAIRNYHAKVFVIFATNNEMIYKDSRDFFDVIGAS